MFYVVFVGIALRLTRDATKEKPSPARALAAVSGASHSLFGKRTP
jgi:hypothetical protein